LVQRSARAATERVEEMQRSQTTRSISMNATGGVLSRSGKPDSEVLSGTESGHRVGSNVHLSTLNFRLPEDTGAAPLLPPGGRELSTERWLFNPTQWLCPHHRVLPQSKSAPSYRLLHVGNRLRGMAEAFESLAPDAWAP
jgi:hypothetical protein